MSRLGEGVAWTFDFAEICADASAVAKPFGLPDWIPRSITIVIYGLPL